MRGNERSKDGKQQGEEFGAYSTNSRKEKVRNEKGNFLGKW